jgi:hypothetical protein
VYPSCGPGGPRAGPRAGTAKCGPLGRGDNWFEKRTSAVNAVCPAANKCAKRFCDHQLNRTYMALLKEMKTITPEDGRTPRLCSVCRQAGHNKKTCQRRQQEA